MSLVIARLYHNAILTIDFACSKRSWASEHWWWSANRTSNADSMLDRSWMNFKEKLFFLNLNKGHIQHQLPRSTREGQIPVYLYKVHRFLMTRSCCTSISKSDISVSNAACPWISGIPSRACFKGKIFWMSPVQEKLCVSVFVERSHWLVLHADGYGMFTVNCNLLSCLFASYGGQWPVDGPTKTTLRCYAFREWLLLFSYQW